MGEGPAKFTLTSKVKHLKQTQIDSGRGDCMRTCIAMVLGADRPEEVPHFLEMDGPGSGWDKAEIWLNEQGSRTIRAYPRLKSVSSSLSADLGY